MPVPASSILPTLDELKTHLNITSATHDDELQDMLDAACDLVAQHVGPLDADTVADEVHDGGGARIVLKRYPVVEVTAASYWDGTAITVADLEVDSATGIVDWGYSTSGYFTSGSRNVRITYTVGRESLPTPIRLAILIVAARLWETQRGGGTSAPRFPGGSGDEFEPDNGALPALPPRAVELLRPYLLGPVVA